MKKTVPIGSSFLLVLFRVWRKMSNKRSVAEAKHKGELKHAASFYFSFHFDCYRSFISKHKDVY